MDVSEALKLLDVDSISKCDIDYIKKTYKRKIKKCHPDLEAFKDIQRDTSINPTSLGEALVILKKEFNRLKNSEDREQFYNEYKNIEKPILITLEDILNVYKNIKSYDKLSEEITKERLNLNNFMFSLDLHINVAGRNEVKEYSLRKIHGDKYNIGYEVYCNKGDTVEVKILDICKEVVMNLDRYVLHFNFNYLVDINLVLDRKDAL